MSKRLFGMIALAVFLAACSSTKVKEEPAPVKDSSVNSQGSSASSSGSGSTSGTDTSNVSGNPLTDPNNILSKRSIYFDFNKDDVKPEYRPLVEAHAKYLKQHPDAKIMIQGNTDDRGSREYNLALGQRRAVSVKNAMNVYGASDNQIETVSYGKEKPRCAEATETCWAQNRRADILYSGE
ncbi:MAG: peptidoglycan-associated lipoprotein Pal [Methylobacillus sp.]|jgi:peptidoglycan-associated lipoprotein|nr:peptidoglycan-associated lipoprotein Pal [Methylobacillus sp.]